MGELRKLVDITLEEAVEVLKLGEGFQEGVEYQLRVKTSPQEVRFAQLFYVWDEDDRIAANFSDQVDAVTLFEGNNYFRTFPRIVRYLDVRGFDLESLE